MNSSNETIKQALRESIAIRYQQIHVLESELQRIEQDEHQQQEILERGLRAAAMVGK